MPEFTSAPGLPADLEHKAVAADPGSALLAADDETGIVEALVSVTGVADEVNDIIEPGAYADTLKKRVPKGIDGHDWGKPVARTIEVKELMPGDPALPKATRDGQPWPTAAGALYVKCQFNMGTQAGRECYENVKFYSKTAEAEWSIGYKVPQGKSFRNKSGQRVIRALSLFEYSPVLFGAAPLSGTLSVKAVKPGTSGIPADDEPVTDWTTDSPADDPQDPITAEADEDDPNAQALHAEAIREMNESPEHWIAIDAASMIDPGEEEAVSSESKSAASPAKVSDKPWSDFSQADYTPQQWHGACLVHNHAIGPGGVAGDMTGMSKDDCKLPVREPDGTLNRNAVHAAAGRLGQVDAPPAAKRSAASHLRGLYKKLGEMPPESLQAKALELDEKAAGQDVTPADMRATERLKSWYVHGGGAAQIGWGTNGDWAKCVAIAGKHMTPDQAKGFCQLRHKDATGFYAGHAPSEQMGHGAAHAAAAVAGKKGVIDPASLDDMSAVIAADVASGMPDMGDLLIGDSNEPGTLGAMAAKAAYDPSLEAGEYAGHLPAEFKSATATAPIEEHLDRVAAAVTTALGGTLPGPDGLPRRMVAVHGTWPDHVIATAYDTYGTPAEGESFRIAYQADDGTVELSDPEPVTLTLGDPGTKGLGDPEDLSALAPLVEHVTAFISRGMRTETKQGRVLSDANSRLLQGAVNQLITVLGNAGIQVGVEANQAPDDDQRALDEATSEPLYMPDSTAPAAQVPMQKSAEPGEGKVLLDPALVASGLSIIADAAGMAGR